MERWHRLKRLRFAARVATLSALAYLAAAPHACDAQGELTAADIRDKIRAAAGVLPTNETVTTTFTRGGVTGTEVRIHSGRDYRDDTTLGPIHTAYGLVGGVPWRQNANGQTIVNVVRPEEPMVEGRITFVKHVDAPSELYVISHLTSLGHGTKEYVDPSTWHVVRFESISATQTTTTTYSDFRTTAGFTRAWHRTSSDGHPENDSSDTILSDDVAAVSAERLAVPKDTRSLVSFPDGRSSVALPVRFDDRSSKFIVRVMVGTRGLDFLLDTGASGIVIDRDVAQSLGLVEYNAYSNAANAGRYVGTTTIVPSLAVGDLTMHDVVVSTTPNVGIRGEDFKVVGLLGFDFFRDVGVKLDYSKETATAYVPDSFAPPVSDRRVDLDVNLASSAPEASVTINGAVGTRFTVDTGGVGALMITDYFRRRNPDAVVDENKRPRPMRFVGVGGEFDANAITLAHYEIGRAPFVDSGAYVIASSTSYGSDEDGTIGPDVLRIFTVYLDLPHAKISLVSGETK